MGATRRQRHINSMRHALTFSLGVSHDNERRKANLIIRDFFKDYDYREVLKEKFIYYYK